MSMAPGTQLGPYEILSPLGAGGMGEVYKANDTRLDRTVAIKVLPEHLSQNPALRERFEREARAVSSLNHPHICTLHDVGEHEGVHFLVMEHIDGETLADRLKQGALPLVRALEYASQIADALGTAHGEGVVHRDLKPGNIMVTKPGVKLLDFGLAKVSSDVVAASTESEPATQQKPLTDAGAIVGTIQYMAPEQLEGKEVDARADLFAFGAVLFEMVTGRKAFQGESKASLISAIMSVDPPAISELQSLSPPALDRIVKSCLEKDPARRWHSAHDLRTQLEWIVSVEDATHKTSSDSTRWRLGALAMALGLATAVAALITREPTPAPIAPRHLNFDLESTDTLSVAHGRPGVIISPDGSRLAYVATRGDGTSQLFVRPVDSYQATPLDGTAGAQYPFFSPDGEWITYLSGLSIQRVSVNGGSPIHVAAYNGFSFAGGDWLPSGDIVLGSWAAPLRRVSPADGAIEPLNELDPGEFGHGFPDVLPDGKNVLFSVYEEGAGKDSVSIVVESLETGERRALLKSVFARYVPTGHLLYLRDRTLMAVPFDLDALAITGREVPVVTDVRDTPAWSADFGFSNHGDLVYVTGSEPMLRQLVLAGEPVLGVGSYASVRVAPGGDRLALQRFGQTLEMSGLSQTWIYDLRRDTSTRLTIGSDAHLAVWTADGQRIVYTGNRDGHHNLIWTSADARDDWERLTSSPNHQIPGSVSPDGRLLAFAEGTPGEAGWDIRLLSLDETRESTTFLATTDDEHSPMFSPDGRWLAYVSNEPGHSGVFVQPFPGPGPKTRIDDDGGTEPVWSRDGRELHYRSRDGTITSVEIHYDGGLRAGASRVRLTVKIASPNIEEAAYDVMPDGSFVYIRNADASSSGTQIRFVTNWFEELKRLAPPDK